MKLVWGRAGRPPPRRLWKGRKPDSVLDSHLSERPNPRLKRYGPHHRRRFGLAPDGVFRAPDIAVGAVGSYPAVSPFPRLREVVCFLWHCPSPGNYSGSPRVNEASRPMESGLSSPPFGAAAIRPSKELIPAASIRCGRNNCNWSAPRSFWRRGRPVGEC